MAAMMGKMQAEVDGLLRHHIDQAGDTVDSHEGDVAEHLAGGAVLTGWIVIGEVATPDGTAFMELHGPGPMPPWQQRGLLMWAHDTVDPGTVARGRFGE